MSVSEGWTRSLRSYLPHSVIATFVVVGSPLLLLWVCTSFVHFAIPPLVVSLAALAFAAVAIGVASAVWERRPGAREISFSELLFWSWYRLQKADESLADAHRRMTEVDSSPEEQLAVLQELSETLESKDPYTKGHSSRVARHSFNIAVALGLSLKEIEVLRKAASLHDVGKVRIPNSVLHKPGKLDDEERALIEEHALLGAWMVSTIGDEQIVRTVRHHHERWDGAGYPYRIAGQEIPLFSRIIAVADTYDAVTSTRSYRAGSSRKRALEIIKTESGTQFDPVVVDAFMTTLPTRAPVLAGVALLAGPQAIWRGFVGWLRSFGSGSIAPALGAVGAAVALGASTFLGPTSAPDRAARVGTVTSVTGAESGNRSAPLRFGAVGKTEDRVLGKRVTDKTKASERKNGSRSRTQTRNATTKESSGSKKVAPERAADAVVAAPERDAPAQPKSSATQVKPQAPSTQPVTDALDEIVDPKKNKGEDCEPGMGKASKGSRLHCN